MIDPLGIMVGVPAVNVFFPFPFLSIALLTAVHASCIPGQCCCYDMNVNKFRWSMKTLGRLVALISRKAICCYSDGPAQGIELADLSGRSFQGVESHRLQIVLA